MPRPKKPGSGEPKTRSRHGCWPCKHRKIKCGEEKPGCQNCARNGEKCDYSIHLNWQGRNKKGGSPNNMLGTSSFSMIEYNPGSNAKAPTQLEPQQMSFQNGAQMSSNFEYSDNSRYFSGSVPETGGSSGLARSPSRPSGLPVPANLDPALSRIRAQSAESYPSPAETSVGSPPGSASYNGRTTTLHHSHSNAQMPPPHPQLSHQQLLPTQGLAATSREQSSEDHRSKRMRLSPSAEVSDLYQAHQQNYQPSNYFSTPNYTSNRPPHLSHLHSYSPSNGAPRVPPTPAASIGSEENQHTYAKPSPQQLDSPSDRRVSIQSLVSGNSPAESPAEIAFQARSRRSSSDSHDRTKYDRYGCDHGLPDLDIPRNKDDEALSLYTPKQDPSSPDGFDADDFVSEFGFAVNAPHELQQQASYYSRPVQVHIPKFLNPLPQELTDNPMNLLYFHHFMDHTARILVPHDCSENPFKKILPKMAVEDPILLHLLLAYSAKHRSRLLKHAEPTTRIAGWMQDVYPALNEALQKDSEPSDSNLATAIMLASLEIISPAPETDGVKVSWKDHLYVAREMILARSKNVPAHHGREVNHFLTRWFAYLDVLGSLSGSNNQPLFHGNYFDSSDEGLDQIDCLMGFTSRCVSILARVAELARVCDSERIDLDGNIRTDWRPPLETVQKADEIQQDLHKARQYRQYGCQHRRSSIVPEEQNAVELVTTNDAFHWAGLIQLHRRVLGKPSGDREVQIYVGEILTALYKIRPGGTAEGCLLFPMFTAGCDALEQGQRAYIMERLQSVEKSGMFQVRQARGLVEKVWETGRSWESFIGEVEFIG